MDIINTKKQIESIEDSSSIYLIEAITDTAGFFANNSKLLYIAQDIYGYSYEGIETDYLKLQTHVRISSVKNNQTFRDDYYNVIIYKGTLDDPNIASFVDLCTVHANNSADLNFKEFFYSLIALFQLPTEQKFKNAIGLYGELKFMQYVLNRRNIDISESWHKSGPYSQYDFSNQKISIEVKTTMTNNYEVTIKHEQIFGGHSCYLVAINCDQYENGETIEEVIAAMYAESNAFNGLNFSINLARELKRVSITDAKEVRFGVRNIQFFSTEDINPFPQVPDAVSKLNYRLDLSEVEHLSEDESDFILIAF